MRRTFLILSAILLATAIALPAAAQEMTPPPPTPPSPVRSDGAGGGIIDGSLSVGATDVRDIKKPKSFSRVRPTDIELFKDDQYDTLEISTPYGSGSGNDGYLILSSDGWPELGIGTTNTNVAHTAFQYNINGTEYSKAANAAGVVPGDDTVPQGSFGAVAFDIDAAGTIDVKEAPNNSTGYSTTIDAVNALPDPDAAHARVGWVSVKKIANGDFTFGTTPLNDADVTANIRYVDASDEIAHPSTVSFKTKFKGYYHWMSYTPYPGGDAYYENPCIAVSNDKKIWISPPPGFTNPIVEKPNTVEGAYNADTHLFKSPDETRLYLAFRERWVDNENKLKLMHLDATGNRWSVPATIKSGTIGTQNYSSPSCWCDGENYTCLFNDNDEAGDPVEKIENSGLDPYTGWGDPATVTITHPIGGQQWWHNCAKRLDSGQVLALFADGTGGNSRLYWATSFDNASTFDVGPANIRQGWYRSTFDPANTDDENDLFVVMNNRSYWTLEPWWGRLGVLTKRANDLTTKAGMMTAATEGYAGVLLADDFNRTDSAVTLGSTLDGTAWTDGANPIGISSNRAYNTSTSGCTAEIDLGTADFTAQIVFETCGYQQWLEFRMLNNGNKWRVGHIGDGVLQVEQYVSGSTVIDDRLDTVADDDVVKVENSGFEVRIYRNSALLAIYQDTDLNGYTKIGLRASGTPTSYFEDLAVY